MTSGQTAGQGLPHMRLKKKKTRKAFFLKSTVKSRGNRGKALHLCTAELTSFLFQPPMCDGNMRKIKCEEK